MSFLECAVVHFCVSNASYTLARLVDKLVHHHRDGFTALPTTENAVALYDRPASGLFQFKAHLALADKLIQTCKHIVTYDSHRRVVHEGS